MVESREESEVRRLALAMTHAATALRELGATRDDLEAKMNAVQDLLSNYEADPDEVLRAIAQVVAGQEVDARLQPARAVDYEVRGGPAVVLGNMSRAVPGRPL